MENLRRQYFDALTGVRLVAALWVVLHHIQLAHRRWISTHLGEVDQVLGPVLMQANRALDLFFVLSGFVLGLNYLERMGPRFDLRGVGRYFWLRFARIWPTYLAITALAGLLIALRAWKWGSADAGELTVSSMLRQAFLVQLWTEPRGRDTSWAGPAWSLSAEWLAYALFPLLALVVFRLARRLGPAALAGLSLLALAPMFVGLLVHHQLSYDYGWAPRVLCLFVAGLLVAAALAHVDPSERHRRVAGLGVPATAVAVLAWIALTETLLPGWYAGFLVVLWLPLMVCLSIGRGWAVDALSHRLVVLGGSASFALYLLHGPVLKLFRDVVTRTRLSLDRDVQLPAELALVPVLVVVACLVHTHWEEPARRALTRLRPARVRGRTPRPAGGLVRSDHSPV